MLIVSKDVIGVSLPYGDCGVGARMVEHSIDHFLTHRGFRWQFASARPISTWLDYENLPYFLKATFLRQKTKHSSIFIDEDGRVYSSLLYVKKTGVGEVTEADIESEVAMYPISEGQIYVFDLMSSFSDMMAGFLAVEGLKDLKKVQDFAVRMGPDGREIIWITHDELVKRIKEKKKLFDAQMDKSLKESLEKISNKYEKPDAEEAPAAPPKPKRRRGRKPSAAATSSEPAAPSEDAEPATPAKPKRKRRTALECVRNLSQPEEINAAPEPPEAQPVRRAVRRRRPTGI